ncbi:MAG: hypothetical protein WBM44_12860 [Waterburya sp.]
MVSEGDKEIGRQGARGRMYWHIGSGSPIPLVLQSQRLPKLP